jgi:hypothetical protein
MQASACTAGRKSKGDGAAAHKIVQGDKTCRSEQRSIRTPTQMAFRGDERECDKEEASEVRCNQLKGQIIDNIRDDTEQ